MAFRLPLQPFSNDMLVMIFPLISKLISVEHVPCVLYEYLMQLVYAIITAHTSSISLGIGFRTGKEYVDEEETAKKGEPITVGLIFAKRPSGNEFFYLGTLLITLKKRCKIT
jgi:hypothetical protein